MFTAVSNLKKKNFLAKYIFKNILHFKKATFSQMADINWLNYFEALGIDLNSDDKIEIEFNPAFLDAMISIIFYKKSSIQGNYKNRDTWKISFSYSRRIFNLLFFQQNSFTLCI